MNQVVKSYLSTRLAILSEQLIDPAHCATVISYELEEILSHFQCRLDAENDLYSLHNRLIGRALEDFSMLFRPFGGEEKDLLNFAVHWYELSNLKTLIRGKFTGKSNHEISNELLDLASFAILPLEKLLTADDPHEMMRMLETTAYASIVRQARRIYEEEHNLFSLDAAIDRLFFNGVAQRIRFLKLEDRQPLSELFGTLMDRINLLWLIRYRFSYNLTAAQSYYLLVTTGKKMHAGNLMQLAKIETLDELITHLPAPLNQLLENLNSLIAIENTMEKYVWSAASQTLKHSNSVLARVFAYVLLREAEIKLAHSIIKGKQLGLDLDLIKQASIGPGA